MSDVGVHATGAPRAPSNLDRALRVVSDVRSGEGATASLMTLNVFLIMLAYYVIKTVREPLILASGGESALPFPLDGAEGKAYAAAVQALLLIPATRVYASMVTRLPTMTLIRRVLFFFAACLVAFWAAAELGIPQLGFVFFVWVGIFNVAAVAQFWSFANDVYRRDVGERIFPVVMVGMTLGGFAGGKLAGALFEMHVRAFDMMLVAAGLLMLHLWVYQVIVRRPDVFVSQATRGPTPSAADTHAPTEMSPVGAFTLIARSRYLQLIAVMLVLANLVNTTGEYLLGVMVTERAAGSADPSAVIGAFYGDYYGTVGLAVFLLQLLLVSRLVKYGGIMVVLLALPLVAIGTYGVIALGAGLGLVRLGKIAENSVDYSVMGTGKAMLWLPTSREEKYKAKLAIDTVFVRLGDVAAGLLVAVGIHGAGFGRADFAVFNLAACQVWLGVASALALRYRQPRATLGAS